MQCRRFWSEKNISAEEKKSVSSSHVFISLHLIEIKMKLTFLFQASGNKRVWRSTGNEWWLKLCNYCVIKFHRWSLWEILISAFCEWLKVEFQTGSSTVINNIPVKSISRSHWKCCLLFILCRAWNILTCIYFWRVMIRMR